METLHLLLLAIFIAIISLIILVGALLFVLQKIARHIGILTSIFLEAINRHQSK